MRSGRRRCPGGLSPASGAFALEAPGRDAPVGSHHDFLHPAPSSGIRTNPHTEAGQFRGWWLRAGEHPGRCGPRPPRHRRTHVKLLDPNMPRRLFGRLVPRALLLVKGAGPPTRAAASFPTPAKNWPCESNSVCLGSLPRTPRSGRVGGHRAFSRGSGHRASRNILRLLRYRNGQAFFPLPNNLRIFSMRLVIGRVYATVARCLRASTESLSGHPVRRERPGKEKPRQRGLSIGAPRFELGTSSPPDWRANQAAPRPVVPDRSEPWKLRTASSIGDSVQQGPATA